jgi:methionyl-tRNA synthetase
MIYNEGMLKLLFGKPTLSRMLVISIPGLFAGILVLSLHPNTTTLTWLTALFAVDLVSGMISNQLVDTNQAWQEIKPIYAYIFIGFHTVIYPAILYVVEKDWLIFGTLLFILSIKLYGFIRGYFLS